MIPKLELLEDRLTPSLPIYHGGLVVQNPAVSTIFVNSYSQKFDDALSIAINQFTQNLGIFDIQSATRNGTVTVNSIPLTNLGIQQLLSQEITNGVIPQPLSTNQVYFVILNQSTVDGLQAYHSWFSYNNTPVVYAVFSTPNPQDDTYGIFHEYAEMTTDPTFQGWYGDNVNQEIADPSQTGGADFNLNGFDAAAVRGPNGQLITNPTSYVSIIPTVPSLPTSVSPTPITVPAFSFGNLFAVWESQINSILAFWENWEASLLSLEGQLWNDLSSWRGEL